MTGLGVGLGVIVTGLGVGLGVIVTGLGVGLDVIVTGLGVGLGVGLPVGRLLGLPGKDIACVIRVQNSISSVSSLLSLPI